MPSVRGNDAFRMEDCGTYLQITAELVRGAQLRRKDGRVFKRVAILRGNPRVMYRASLSISCTTDTVPRFQTAVQESRINGSLDGVDVALTDGVLRCRVPVSSSHVQDWTRTRTTGTKYILVHFTLPTYYRLGEQGRSDYVVELCVSRWSADESELVPSWVLG